MGNNTYYYYSLDYDGQWKEYLGPATERSELWLIYFYDECCTCRHDALLEIENWWRKIRPFPHIETPVMEYFPSDWRQRHSIK